MQDRVFTYTQAKVIGGGSAINAQVYTRGNALDYDEWRQKGCTGWGYEDVLPYFRKAEDNDTFDNRYHGKGGPLGVSQPRAPLPICEAYFEAAAALGIPRNTDMNGETQDGVAYYQLTQRNARRSSAAMAYVDAEPRAPEPAPAHRDAGAPDHRRGGRATGRGAGRTARALTAAQRSDPVVGRDRLAAAAAALGDRTGGPSGRARHRRGAATSPRWARTCRIISTSTASARCPARTPMTALPSRICRPLQACNTC